MRLPNVHQNIHIHTPHIYTQSTEGFAHGQGKLKILGVVLSDHK